MDIRGLCVCPELASYVTRTTNNAEIFYLGQQRLAADSKHWDSLESEKPNICNGSAQIDGEANSCSHFNRILILACEYVLALAWGIPSNITFAKDLLFISSIVS